MVDLPRHCRGRGWLLLAGLVLVGCVVLLVGVEAEAPTTVTRLRPAPGRATRANPITLTGRVEGARPRHLAARSRTHVTTTPTPQSSFALPIYLWASDGSGRAMPVDLVVVEADGGQRVVETLTFSLPALDLEGLEARLAALDAQGAADPGGACVAAVGLADALLSAGHPIFASVVVDRLARTRCELATGQRLRLARIDLQLGVVLGQTGRARSALAPLAGACAGATARGAALWRGLGERLFELAALARASGLEAALWRGLLGAGNRCFAAARLLPRRLR